MTKPPLATAQGPGVQLCAFCLGSEEYVIDIMRIEEILQLQKVTPVPRAPSFVEGVVNLRGVIVPVVDLRKRLSSGPPRPRLKPKLLVCRIGRRRVGLMVDGVTEVVRVQKSDIKPAPGLSTQGSKAAVIGVCGPPDRLKLLLDLKAVLQEGGG
ncbi:MAG: chemotaxis protein CheW [Myxococcaceae bacterium]